MSFCCFNQLFLDKHLLLAGLSTNGRLDHQILDREDDCLFPSKHDSGFSHHFLALNSARGATHICYELAYPNL